MNIVKENIVEMFTIHLNSLHEVLVHDFSDFAGAAVDLKLALAVTRLLGRLSSYRFDCSFALLGMALESGRVIVGCG